MSRLSISFEGAETLRAFSREIFHAVEQLREAEKTLERDVFPLLENLGDLESDAKKTVLILKEGTNDIIESSESLSADLEGTAQRILDYLLPRGGTEAEIAAIAEADNGILSEIALDVPHLTSCLSHNASTETTECLRGERTHRHPARGTWFDHNRQPIDASAFSNQGVFYWQPNPSEIYSGSLAKDIMHKYGFTEILFRNGYPVFPESTVLLEVGLDNLLSSNRTTNFREAAQAVTSKVFLLNLHHCASDSFKAKVSSFLKEKGFGGSWFTNRAQVDAFMKQNKLTWHEKEDMLSIQIIPREVHEMIAHDGGVSNAKLRDATVDDLLLLAREATEQLVIRSK